MKPGAAAQPPQPFFLDGGADARFCLYYPPVSSPVAPLCRGAIVYLHPFAEEMNKSRRMASLQAAALAADGYAVLRVDLHGCGDSAGDFGDATWEGWLADVERASRWLRQHLGDALTEAPAIWGLRLGALLALDHARRAAAPPAFVLLWQPVTSGAVFLTQFLRLAVASQMLTADGGASGGTAALRTRLATGYALEIAGYLLNPALATAIDTLDTGTLPPPCPVHWLEVVPEAARPLPAAAARIVARWQEAGILVDAHAVPGPQFWATQEIATCPALLDQTRHVLQALHHAAG